MVARSFFLPTEVLVDRLQRTDGTMQSVALFGSECFDCRDQGRSWGRPRERMLGGKKVILCERHWQARLKLDWKRKGVR